jgi:hypothetical protein
MDPNSQNPQEDSEAIKKLENDLSSLTEEAKSVESQSLVPTTIPEEQPIVSTPVVEAPPVVPTGPEIASTEPQTATVPPKPTKKGQPLVIVAIILIVLAVLAVVAYVFGAKLFAPGSKQVACTLEARICPDGSAVGRTGPNCEFDTCPSPTPDVTASWKTYTEPNNEYSFKYPSGWLLLDPSEGLQIEVYYQPDKTISVGEILIEKISASNYNNETQQSLITETKLISEINAKCKTEGTSKTWCFLKLEDKYLSIMIVKENDIEYNQTLDLILSTFKFTGQTSDLSMSNSYTIGIPISWQGKYIKTSDDSNGCESYDFKGQTSNSKIFSICRTSLNTWSQMQTSSAAHPTEDSVLAKDTTYVYYYYINLSNDYSGNEAITYQNLFADVSSIVKTFKLK